MITDENIQNLKYLRSFIIENKDKIADHFDMRSITNRIIPGALFRETLEEALSCGTNCCLLGWSIFVPELRKQFNNKKVISWNKFQDLLIGERNCSYVCDFLFSTAWSNDINIAIRRLDYVIQNGTIPKDYNYNDTIF